MNEEMSIMAAHYFRVVCNDEEYEFLKKLARHDNITLHQEAQQLFSLQVWEEQQVGHEFDDYGEG